MAGRRKMAMKALIAMSGGVDSSVAALIMRERGYECIGCTMKLFECNTGAACEADSNQDINDARSVAASLGMPYYVFDFENEFSKYVISRFVKSYEAGLTPNPCIECNRYIKFGLLYEKLKELGCDYLVTGHYAKVEYSDGRYRLKKANDKTKDQSYVLYSLGQEKLEHTILPLGEMHKTDIREAARRYGFVNSEKPESQDICFVRDGDYASVIEEVNGEKSEPGDFIGPDGEVIGRHKGIIHYTIGQRRGLGISYSEPLFVCEIHPEDNTVVLGTKDDQGRSEAFVEDVSWVSGKIPSDDFRCTVKTRYHQREEACAVTVLEDDSVRICFEKPQRALAPGQFAVMYNGDEVIGGGVITNKYVPMAARKIKF